MKGRRDLAEELRESQRLASVAVPTSDVDVKRMLRSLKQPICLFGEDPTDRKDRLRHLLATAGAPELVVEPELPECIPKYETGGDAVSALKRFLIAYSIPRSRRRIQSERPIDRARIDAGNAAGGALADYALVASACADRRPLTRLAVSADLFAVGSLSGAVSVYSVGAMELFAGAALHTNRVCGLAFATPALLCSASADQSVCLWDIAGGSQTRVGLDGSLHSLALHPSGRVLAAGLSDGTFAVLDVETQKVVARMQSNDGTVSALSFHGDGGLAYAGGADAAGRLWDLRSFRALKVLRGHEEKVTCAVFDAGFHVVTASADHSMICWDIRNLQRSRRISGHLSPVSSVDVRGDLLLSASLDASVRVWSMLDFRAYLTVGDCPSPVVGAGFGPCDPPLVVTASRDGSWRFYHSDIL